MVWKGLERSVITYSSLISACEKAGRWETALQLFDEMTRDGCSPNTVTYNSLITACGQGAPLWGSRFLAQGGGGVRGLFWLIQFGPTCFGFCVHANGA